MTKKKDQEEIDKEQRALILSKVQDIVHDLLYHDRKEDKDMSSKQLFDLIGDRIVSTSDIINTFAVELRREVQWKNK